MVGTDAPRGVRGRFVGLAIGGAWVAAAALLVAYTSLPAGVAFSGDSVRDVFAGDRVLHGALPLEGPSAGSLGFTLSLLWPLLVAAMLSASHSPAWLSATVPIAFALGAVLAAPLATRLSGPRSGPVATALVLGSTPLLAVVGLFTHSAFVLPFEIGGLVALLDSLASGAGLSYPLALLLLSAAGQLHGSALPLVALVLVRTWRAPDVAWRYVCAGVVAALAPLVPMLGEARFRNAWSTAGPLAALASWFTDDTLLVPAVLVVVVAGRPSLLRRVRSRRIVVAVALAAGAWAAYVVLARHGLLRLANVAFLRPHGLDAPAPPIAWEPLRDWALGCIEPFGRTHGAAETVLAVLVAVALAWGLVLAVVRACRPADPLCDASRLLVAQIAITVPPAYLSVVHTPSFQPQYLMHVALVAALLAASGLDAIAAGVTSFFVLRRTYATALLALVSALAPPVALPVLVALASRSGAVLAVVALAALVHAPALRPPGSVSGLERSATMRAVIAEAARRHDTYASIRAHVHGATGAFSFGDEVETTWMLEACFVPLASRGSTTDVHEIVVTPASRRYDSPHARRVAGTAVALVPHETSLDLDRVTMAVGTLAARPVRLPLGRRLVRVVYPASCPERGVELPPRGTVVPVRITVPRVAPAPQATLHVLVTARIDPESCSVRVAYDGRELAAVGAGRDVRDVVAALPPASAPGTIDVAVEGCTPDDLDVYDDDPE